MSDDVNREIKRKKKRVFNRATGRFEKDTAAQSPGMWETTKDILSRATRGGLKTDKRTKRHLKKK